MGYERKEAASPGRRRRLSRRETLLAGLALAGGGIAGGGILHAAARSDGAGGEPGGDPKDFGRLAAAGDEEVLCRAEAILSRAEATPWGDLVRRLLLRLLCACMENVSAQNDLIAARCIYLLACNRWLSAEAAVLVRGTPGVPVAQAALAAFAASTPGREE
jgi:hypothetical protein